MIFVNATSALCSLGVGKKAVIESLARNCAPGLRRSERWLLGGKNACFGEIAGNLPELPAGFEVENTRNNRALLGCWLSEPRFAELFAASNPSRVAVVLGTSTSGSDEADRYVGSRLRGVPPAPFSGLAQELGDPARFLSRLLGATGPAYTISTACTSSARAIISAARLIRAGLADCAIAGGADTLARMPVNGFDSLEALSCDLCRPFALDRHGITIGEGAGLLWLSRSPSGTALLGWGESSDGHHMSAPDPEGAGAISAMRGALAMAGLDSAALSYVNLHGTGTRLNDAMESKAVSAVMGEAVLASSTKTLTGHALGAAGAIEAVIACALSEGGRVPPQFAPGVEPDPTCSGVRFPLNFEDVAAGPVMTNNFAFGGSNTSLIFGAP